MIFNKHTVVRLCSFICAFALTAACCGGVKTDASFSSSYLDSGSISVAVDTSAEHREISPYIYGINAESSISGVKVNAIRQSDPRISSYNWENNYSNAGGTGDRSDLSIVSGYPSSKQREPALYTENLVTRAKRYGIPAKYVTLQMMGAVAGSGDTPWEKVVFSKNDNYLSSPDTDDGVVYMDEYVSYLADKYGYASDGGISGYFLGYEPENWSVSFPEAVNEPVSAAELVARSAELADSVKKIDRTAQLFGPSVNGIEAFINIRNASDWEKYSNDYSWFIDYYLDFMKTESEKAGTRLLDVLDLHYHTEATNGLLKPIINSSDELSNNARLQATRILWDNSYIENSSAAQMHTQHIPLIPTLKASVDMYYPGTKLSFSEYNFGGCDDISGGIAAADALGIFAEYEVYMACAKPNTEDISYLKSAINMYTNYDGEGSGFGDTLVKADNGGDNMSSVYAALNDGDETSLRILLINKNRQQHKTADIYITSPADFPEAEVYSFGEESPDIVRAEDTIELQRNVLTIEMEPQTVYMLVLNGSTDDVLEDNEDKTVTTEIIGTEISDNASHITHSETEHTDVSDVNDETVSFSESISDYVYPDTETVRDATETTSVSEYVTDQIGAEADTDPAVGSGSEAEKTVSGAYTTAVDIFEDGRGQVPAAVKVIVSLLVAAVVIAMGYILVNDYISRKNRPK